jgi:crotonobetainyl-CoA:carnitine CoA-transferase CaiB-like acyl-CoA transferase
LRSDRGLSESLTGLRVLDASRVLAGPFATQILGDLGAEIIKVEQPNVGDETRHWGPPFANGLTSYFSSCNRNKKSITLDLSQAKGREVFDRLAVCSDIVFENFGGQTSAKLGLTPHRLHALKPELVIVAITAFGKDGAFADRPGYDFAVQAMSGLMDITGPVEGPPSKVGVAIVDIITGLYAGTAALAALHARQKSGHGYAVDVSLLDCAMAAQANVLQAYIDTGIPPKRRGNAHAQIVPYELFQSSDGWLALAVGNDAQWRRFCVAANLGSLAEVGDEHSFDTNQGRVIGRTRLIERLSAVIRTRTTDSWCQALVAAEVPHSPVWGYPELLASDLGKSRGIKIRARRPDGQEVELVRSPLTMGRDETLAPPHLGQHTDEILSGILNMKAQEIESLKTSGVV